VTFRFTLNTLIICIIYIVGKTGCYIMTRCPLMEGTREVRSPPIRQPFKPPRRRSGLDKVLLKQSRKQLCILHKNQIIMRCFLSMILWIELLRSLLSRLLLILLKPGLITWILCSICDRNNNDNRVLSRILSLRPTCQHTHFPIFLIGNISGNTFFNQTSFSDPFF